MSTPTPPPLRPWSAGDPISATRLNALQDAVRSIMPGVGDAVEVVAAAGSVLLSSPGRQIQLVRARITAAPPPGIPIAPSLALYSAIGIDDPVLAVTSVLPLNRVPQGDELDILPDAVGAVALLVRDVTSPPPGTPTLGLIVLGERVATAPCPEARGVTGGTHDTYGTSDAAEPPKDLIKAPLLTQRLVVREGISDDWEGYDPVLMLGEIGLARDTREARIGDGVSPWTGLSPVTWGPGEHRLSPVGGGGEIPITAATTLTAANMGRMHRCTYGASDYTVTLPLASGQSGRYIGFRVEGASPSRFITIQRAGSSLIEGATSVVLWQHESIELYCDGTHWWRIGGTRRALAAAMNNNSGGQVFTSGIIARAAMNQTLADNSGRMASNAAQSITIRRAGTYMVACAIAMDFTAAGRLQAWVVPDGSFGAGLQGEVHGEASTSPTLSMSRPMPFAAGVVLEFWGRQFTGANANMETFRTYFSVTEVLQ